MGDWPVIGGASRYQVGLDPGFTGNASANTKATSYTTMIASLNSDAIGLLISAVDANTPYGFLMDIAVGAESSETIIIADLLFNFMAYSTREGGIHAFFPISIPAGTRISGRVASSTGSKVLAVTCAAALKRGLAQSLNGVFTMGASAADTGGTQIDPGGSAGTKGDWVQLEDATPFEFQALGIAFGNQINTARTSCLWSVDIALGSSYDIIIPDLSLRSSSTSDSIAPAFLGPLPLVIPKGTEINVRASCDTTDATDRLFDVVLYGVY